MIDLLFNYKSPLLWGLLGSFVFLAIVLVVIKFYIVPFTKKLLGIKNELEMQKMENELLGQRIRTAVFLETSEKERKRISQLLHDQLLPVLYTSKFSIESAIAKDIVDKNILNETISNLAAASDDLKNIIYELTPVELDVVDLKHALSNLINTYKDKHELGIDVNEFNIPSDLDKNTSLLIYRIIKELLLNVKKHAEAAKTEITVFEENKKINIGVKDNGKGFDYKSYETGRSHFGYGLSHLYESVNQFKGKVDITSSKGEGTEVNIEIPV
ncbi:MAG: ATP-binding protein [Ignavibacteria bacterium]|jgi:signal transduction histidine kinase